MKTVIMFDTAIGTMNQGDNIIMDSVIRGIQPVIKNKFVIHFPTHTPCFKPLEKNALNRRYRFVKNADYKFLCGTNILHNRMFHPFNTWCINLFDVNYLSGMIGVGIGCSEYEKEKQRFYSGKLFKRILSDCYIHSARDDATVKVLEGLGKKAINTGCATLWKLTPEHCSLIPTEKANRVVFTLTDYCKSIEKDRFLINFLLQNYQEVFYWPQGLEDCQYLSSLTNTDKIKILSPNLLEYSELLRSGNIDYIGTRLHGGIFAMQNFVRSIIITVDNRARDMSATYSLKTIEREEIDKLDSLCYSKFSTRINLNREAINKWIEQFMQ